MPTRRKVEQVLERADITVTDLLNDGGHLPDEQANAFIDEVEEQPTLLNQVRFVRMNAPTVKIDKIGIDSRIMKAAPQGTQPFAADDGTNSRILAAADRSKVTTRQVELVAKEVMAELHIPYDVLEDNLERGNFETHVMTLMARRASQDLEEWFISADTGNVADDYLALEDGILARLTGVTSNVVDNMSAGVNPDMFADAMLAMPQRYLRNLGALKHFVTVQDAIRYRSNVSQRATGYGDSALQGNIPLAAHGVDLVQTPFMAQNTAVFCNPQNLIFGIYRDILVETERLIRARELVIVMSTRVAVSIEDTQGCVKVINVN